MSWIKNTVLQKKNDKVDYHYLWERLANNKELGLVDKQLFYTINDYSNYQKHNITYINGCSFTITEVLKFGDHPNVIQNIWKILIEALVYAKGLEKGVYFPGDLITNNTPQQVLKEMFEMEKDSLLFNVMSNLTEVPKWLDKKLRMFIIEMQIDDNSIYRGLDRSHWVNEYKKYKEIRKIIDD